MGDKLKQILSLRKDIPYFSNHLQGLGLSTKNINDAIKAGALERLATGLYQFAGVAFSPLALVEALQSQGWSNFYIGGATALLLRGQAQYVRKRIYLYSPQQSRLPSLNNIFHKGNIRLKVSSLFGSSKEGLEKFTFERRNLVISSTERAVLETIDLLPKDLPPEELKEIFEHLPPFNEEKLQKLLKLCGSKRVIRIFGFFAEKSRLKFKNLTSEKILRMSGKSIIYVNKDEDSDFISYWKIMIPQNWREPANEKGAHGELP